MTTTTATLREFAPPVTGTRPVVEVRDLTKRYGSTTTLHGISFSVEEGELFGLLGTNGAGKTTTVEILQGLRQADGGSARVLGLDPARSGDQLRRLVGAQLQDAALPERMRVGEALRFFAALHPSPRPLGELAEEWQLDRLLRRPFGALSGGERQRLFVALALVGRPRLVFLDELTQNLDPVGRRHTWDVIRRVRDTGTTVVLVTHDVEEAERLCDRIVVMHRGRVRADGTPASIVASLGGLTTVSFTDADIDVRELRNLPGVERVTRHGPQVEVAGAGPVLAHVGAHLVRRDRPALDLHARRPTLEDRFIDLTQEPTPDPTHDLTPEASS
jgi:ABC-2 type transport system ATP-binding protein